MTTTERTDRAPWTAPKVEKLDLDLRAVAQGRGSIGDIHKAANARASK